jgi:hypothetical protein
MTFGLKNAGATYQWAMNYIFHKLIGKIVEMMWLWNPKDIENT